jgi:hypothetical protein
VHQESGWCPTVDPRDTSFFFFLFFFKKKKKSEINIENACGKHFRFTLENFPLFPKSPPLHLPLSHRPTGDNRPPTAQRLVPTDSHRPSASSLSLFLPNPANRRRPTNWRPTTDRPSPRSLSLSNPTGPSASLSLSLSLSLGPSSPSAVYEQKGFQRRYFLISYDKNLLFFSFVE